MAGSYPNRHNTTDSAPFWRQLLGVARPWVYFLWMPALVFGGVFAVHETGWSQPLDLYALMWAAIFAAMMVQHFLHVAGGSSSTRVFGGSTRSLLALAGLSAIPLLTITAYFAVVRGPLVVVLFLIGVACIGGYAYPPIKSEWYWGIGQAVVGVTTFYLLTGTLTASVGVGAVGIACAYYNMLHSARLAEGDYLDAEDKREKGYYGQRYAFFIGTIALMTAFII